MRIVTVVYGSYSTKMIDALKRSIDQNTKGLNLEVIEVEAERGANNDRFPPKVVGWNQIVATSSEDLLLIDADTLVLRDPRPVFRGEFDLAHAPYKRSDGKKFYNTGVLFVRPNSRTIGFFNEWMNETYRVCALPKPEFKKLKDRWKGSDQISFAHTINNWRGEITIKGINRKWNMCNGFQEFSEGTGILHLKGFLHKHALLGKMTNPAIDETVRRYYCEQD
jgi:hypothetical protein